MKYDTKISGTLSRYLGRLFLINLLIMVFILLGVVWIFDIAELLRRAAKLDGVPFGTVIAMGFLKLPEMAQTLFPFIVLFASLFSFWQLSKRSELVVMRAAGISAWQFLKPIFIVGFSAGIIMTSLLNPVGSLFYSKYIQLESQYFDRNNVNTVAVFEGGLWLRQPTADGYAILHAKSVTLPDWKLSNVFALFFSDDNKFHHRLDARTAKLDDQSWVFRNVTEHKSGEVQTSLRETRLPTSLTREEIEESFSSPESIGFWSLPNFIGTLERTGFDSTKLRIHFHVLLALPFLCCAMILLASTVALRPQRGGDTFIYILTGVGIGFGVFFFSNFLQALGASHQVPVFLAAWTPALLSILVASTILLTQEDG
jgi:lipopolysaccharide export system permease protein